MGVLEIESRYEGPEAGKNIADLKSERRKWTAVYLKEWGEHMVTYEAVKVSRGQVMVGLTDHLRCGLYSKNAVLCLVAQSCMTLSTPWTGACHAHGEFSRPEYWSGLLCSPQGIFPTQGLSPGLLHCGWILHHLRHTLDFVLERLFWPGRVELIWREVG